MNSGIRLAIGAAPLQLWQQLSRSQLLSVAARGCHRLESVAAATMAAANPPIITRTDRQRRDYAHRHVMFADITEL